MRVPLSASKRLGIKSGLAQRLVREQRVEHVVAPFVADPKVVAQPTFATESEFLGQRPRRRVVGMDESLRAMEAEVAEAEFEHGRNGLAAESLPLARWIDDIANGHALTADVAVMIVDHAEAAIGPEVSHRPKAIVGRGAVDEAADCALSLDPARVDRRIPEAHRLGVGEALVHRARILGAKLAQAQTGGYQGRVWRGLLCHISSPGARLLAARPNGVLRAQAPTSQAPCGRRRRCRAGRPPRRPAKT